jgi:hypothetical protein
MKLQKCHSIELLHCSSTWRSVFECSGFGEIFLIIFLWSRHRYCSNILLEPKGSSQLQAQEEGQKAVPELITKNGREELSLEEAACILLLHPHEYFRNPQSLIQWCSCPPAALICITSKDAEKSCCPAGYYRLNCHSVKAIAMLNEIRTRKPST